MMLTVEVDFLTGRYIAAHHNDRDLPEWPPHPARLFSALVAEWATSPNPSPAEKQLLHHLECCGSPRIGVGGARKRTSVIHYVPVNDATIVGETLWGRVRKAEDAWKELDSHELTDRQRRAALSKLGKARDVSSLVEAKPNAKPSGMPDTMPEARKRQARTFPSMTLIPEADGRCVVTFTWPDADFSKEQRIILDGLLARVTRLGHSSSLVSCRLLDMPAERFSHWPDPGSSELLRTAGPGQFDALVEHFRRHQGHRPRSLPAVSTPYATSSPEAKVIPRSLDVAGEWFTFEITPRLGAPALAKLTSVIRDGLLKACEASGSARGRDIFVLGLPNVGHPRSTGDLLGGAVVIPRDLAPAQRLPLLRAVKATLDGIAPTEKPGMPKVKHINDPVQTTLQKARWSRRSRTWYSATPLVIAGSPDRKLTADQYDSWLIDWLSQSCTKAGLPKPISIETTSRPLLAGTRPVGRFPRIVQAGRIRRLVHARIEFDTPVAGPLLIGGQRNLGFGLMTPMEDRNV